MNCSIEVEAGEQTDTQAWFYGAVTVQLNYYGTIDTARNGWVFEWVKDRNGKSTYHDKTLGQALKTTIETLTISRFEEELAKRIGHQPFQVRLTAQDLGDQWLIHEYDWGRFDFHIPKNPNNNGVDSHET